MTREKDKLVQQSEAQRNPYLARPEDFTIMSAADAAQKVLSGHGQRGENMRQYNRLLEERKRDAGKSTPTRKDVDLPAHGEDALLPVTRRR